MKILIGFILGILFLGIVASTTFYIIDIKDTEKVNFITTDLFCEKLGIEKYQVGLKDEVSKIEPILNPCYKELDVSHLDISKVTIKLEDKEVEVYRID